MELNKDIVRTIEEYDFTMNEIQEQNGEYYVEIGRFTPAGEDWWECIWFDGTNEDFINKVVERYNTFDVDEEVEPWIEMRGERGTPSSIKVLVEDAEWKEYILGELQEALKELDIDDEE